MAYPITASLPTASPQESEATPASLTDLLVRIATGDQEAFASLYAQTCKRVYGLVLRVIKNAAISAEVVQEVYLMLWTTAGQFDAGRGSAQSWIFTLAHRRAVDRVRSEQSSSGRDTAYSQRSAAVKVDSIEEAVHHTLMCESVRKCLASLTERQAEAINLAYYGGLTYVEVAEKLHIKLPTAKSRIQAGLIRLRDALEADGYDSHSR
ncbi:RNA polymerase sigma-70 factor (ECF subfamily) [Arthrobacter sp. CAN_A212]|uniref:ECF RNA polymerase sigma factor SigK n=1 Tax=unclassified Arthrobacter TaxID=235627 RepID=UPI0018CA6AD4|nr:ECF RNA polymerase sigma factor SigK [Arthrobacter sp. CAN_C5]MBP2217217.1 RNA polymerase sigma-70 factor (ECF subfamily) [Arthrobacter sp. CAN_C5]